MSEDITKKGFDSEDYELREEYDLRQMTIVPKGRYDPQRRVGRNVVLLAPDVAQVFPSDEAVNEALRLVILMAKLAQVQPVLEAQ